MTMAETALTDTTDIQTPEHEVILTETAAAKVASLLAQEGRDDLRLRVAVPPGGRAGWGAAGPAGSAVGVEVGLGTWEKTSCPEVRLDQWE